MPKKEQSENQNQEEVEQLREQLLRTQAEFENFRKRTESEQAEMRSRAKVAVLERLLPVLDNFGRAVGCAPQDDWSRGVCQLFGNFEREMGELGLQRIKAEGEKFDAERHEALMTEKSKDKKDMVLEELAPGWEVEGVVIRPAKVKVGV